MKNQQLITLAAVSHTLNAAFAFAVTGRVWTLLSYHINILREDWWNVLTLIQLSVLGIP